MSKQKHTWDEIQDARRRGNKVLAKIKKKRQSAGVVDLSKYKNEDKREPLRLSNAGQTIEAFGETTCERDGHGNLWIKFLKGKFQIFICPSKDTYTLIRGID